jgi:myo-inositol catabolism protein IolC
VLVRWNPDGDVAGNSVQAVRLRALSEWLRLHDRRLLFELIVEPTPAQLEAAGGDRLRFEREQRPALVRRAMAAIQEARIEVAVWKLEGLDAVADAEAVVEQARSGDGREDVVCTVLGAGAATGRVEHWLRVAARVDGFAGFAIGRSIWRDPVRAHLAGALPRDQAARRIAERYLRFVDVYASAARGPRSGSLPRSRSIGVRAGHLAPPRV